MADVEKTQGQMSVIKDAFGLTRRENPLSLLFCALLFIAVEILSILAGTSLKHPIYFGILGVPLGLLAAFFLFTRFANRDP